MTWFSSYYLTQLSLCWTDMEATIDSHCVAMETGGFDRTIVFMSYCANLYWDKMRVGVFGHPCPVLARRFLLNANKEARRRKNPPSFPSMPRCRACPWCHNKCIYTATGEHFFLHCYIVTNGAGAKPGEQRLLVRKPAASPTETRRYPRYSEKTAK